MDQNSKGFWQTTKELKPTSPALDQPLWVMVRKKENYNEGQIEQVRTFYTTAGQWSEANHAPVQLQFMLRYDCEPVTVMDHETHISPELLNRVNVCTSITTA